jgi:6-phosphogluconolactonase
MAGNRAVTARTTCYADLGSLSERLAAQVADELATALQQERRVTLVVPGGTTPQDFLQKLSFADLDWGRVDITLSDERWAPPSSPRSNFGMLKRTLLANGAAAARAVPLYRKTKRPDAALDEIEADLRELLPIEVCVLGMGADGHTASLFPDADRLQEALSDNSPHLALPMRLPDTDEPRITLTANVLRNARHRHLMITGEEKKSALDTALQPGAYADAPVRVVLDGVTTQVHYAP